MDRDDKTGRFMCNELDEDWLLDKVDTIPESGCWLWRGYVDQHGYGKYRNRKDDKNWLAHRMAYKIRNGELPRLLMHSCDIKSCVNPEHLSPGNHRQNARDMVDRQGRNAGMWKKTISDQTIDEIRAADGTYRAIAERYGISGSTVSRIKNRKHTNRERNP